MPREFNPFLPLQLRFLLLVSSLLLLPRLIVGLFLFLTLTVTMPKIAIAMFNVAKFAPSLRRVRVGTFRPLCSVVSTDETKKVSEPIKSKEAVPEEVVVSRNRCGGGEYIGEKLPNGMRHGKGSFTTGSHVYTGEWRANKRHGSGIEYAFSGESFEGLYVKDKRHGPGKSTFKDGSTVEGKIQVVTLLSVLIRTYHLLYNFMHPLLTTLAFAF